MVRRRSYRRLRRYSPRRSYRRFRRGKAPIPLLPTIAALNSAVIQPVFGDPASGLGGALNVIMGGGSPQTAVQEFTDILGINFLGYKFSNGSFNFYRPMQTYTTLLLAALGHKAANALGVNRYIKKVPLVGKYFNI